MFNKLAGRTDLMHLNAASGHVCNSSRSVETEIILVTSFLLSLPLCPLRIEFLRHIRDFFQIMFKIDVQKPLEDERKGGDKVLMTCVGVGYSNMNKTLK